MQHVPAHLGMGDDTVGNYYYCYFYHYLFRNPKSYPHPRLQDFPRWKKT